MNTNDRIEYEISKTQGELYEHIYMSGLDIALFSDRYLSSDFCRNQMDCDYSPHQLQYPELLESYIFEEITVPKERRFLYDNNAVFWAGYMYRYLALKKKLKSREIVEVLPFERMVKLFGLHTLDDDMAVERICHEPLN